MEPVIYIHQQHCVYAPQNDKVLRQKLKEFGIDGRRMSRFTQLALLGILPLQEHIPSQSALYLASPFNSPSKFDKMFHSLMEHNLPSPLDFMANLGNATTFQIAQILQLTGTSIFLATDVNSYTQPLWLAINELMSGATDYAVVGWAYERNSENETRAEGSHWLVLSTQAKSAVEILPISALDQIDIHFAKA